MGTSNLEMIAVHDGLTGAARLFPIIGDPVAGLRSPERLTRSFAERGHLGVCVPMKVPSEDLAGVLHGLSLVVNVDGVLITMPHKIAAVAHCETLSERSALLGIVNVMRRNDDRSWHGDMIDGVAHVRAQTSAGARPDGARVLLVGAGGAGRAIAAALLSAGARELIVHDTDHARATRLVELCRAIGGSRVRTGRPDPTDCDIVCNATPLGMNAGDALPVPAGLLTRAMFVGDVVAGHGLTPFVRAARLVGCMTADGDQMVEAAQQLTVDFMLGT